MSDSLEENCGSLRFVCCLVTFPTDLGAALSDNCENTQSSCALLAATEVSTAGFDHHVDRGDRASRAAETHSQWIHYPV